MRSLSSGQLLRPVTFSTEDGVQLRGSYGDARAEGAISVVLLHDKNADRSIWDPYVGLFLSRGWSVLTFDLRGHGESLRHEVRADLLAGAETENPVDAGWALDIQAALSYAARQPMASSGRCAALGLGLGGDLAYAAAARGWGTASSVCVSPDDSRARTLAGAGAFQPRAVYLIYGELDPVGADAALAFAASALYPSECTAYEGSSLTGLRLWEERQPEIAARAIAWIERTV